MMLIVVILLMLGAVIANAVILFLIYRDLHSVKTHDATPMMPKVSWNPPPVKAPEGRRKPILVDEMRAERDREWR